MQHEPIAEAQEVFWAKVEDRLMQINQEFEYEKQVTQTKIQAVEVVLKDLREDMNNVKAVSYTHLTLPTILRV